MARRNKETEAIYECVQQCTIWVEVNGETVEKLYYPYDEDMESEVELWQVTVPQGTVVCKHFVPYNDIAEDDRDDQMENPGKYVEDEKDIITLGEIMAKKGFFRDEFGANEKGDTVLKRTSTQVAVEAIKDMLGDDAIINDTDSSKRAAALEVLTSHDGTKEGIKACRQKLGKILRDGGVSGFFPGAEPLALAELVYDNELYTGE